MNQDKTLIRFAKIIIGLQIVAITMFVLFPHATVTFAETAYEVFFFSEDTAHTTGDKGFFFEGVRQDTATGTTPTSASGDYSYIQTNMFGMARVEPFYATSTIARTSGLNGLYETSVETATTTFSTVGFRECSFDYLISSFGTGGHELRIRYYQVGDTAYNGGLMAPLFFEYGWGGWAKNFYDDTMVVATGTGRSDTFPASKTGTGAIEIQCNTSCGGGLGFFISSSTISCIK